MTHLSHGPDAADRRPGPLLRQLRLETSEAHLRLETDLALTSGDLGRVRYEALLARLHGFHAVHEPRLDRLFEGETFWPPRRRLEPIEHDLRLLGRTTGEIARLPQAPVPPILNRNEAFGCLYVFEGATLGGKVIARHLAKQGDLPEGCVSYFSGRGPQTGAMWRETCELLERQVPAEGRGEVTRAARSIFTALHDWLMPTIGTGDVRT